jgi:L-2,4-diaminobutyrate transaminase
VSASAVEHGVMIRALPYIEVVSFSPPLCISKAECDQAIEKFGAALDAVTPELVRRAAAAA